MKFFGFLIGVLCCTIVSCDLRPLDPNNVVQLDSRDTRDTNYRLPNNTIPHTYDITLTTSVDEDIFDFDGTVNIVLEAIEESSSITLHVRQLTIKTISLLVLDTGADIALNEYTLDAVTEFLVIPLKSKKLEKGKTYRLSITYTGILRTDNGGFYRSKYVDANGITRYLATTQFESTDARHAFPCYDEPALKANFTIHIIHGQDYNAISNTVGTSSATSNNKIQTDFETTPLMSTYLIAFIVSDFGYNERNASDTNPTHQRVFTSKNKLSQTAYALEEGVNILNAIAKYVSVPFTLSKMDQAAIPDFRAGAMENWGLVTYREPYLLYDESTHLPSRKLTISTIISHEFGHQWFGDLVSPKWWTYIWLNEGFATLFEYLGAGLVHPEWNIWNYFVTREVQSVLLTDAEANTRAMSTYAESPNGVSGLFDSIAYAKSGSVIRMFLHALGETTFQKGLNYYLNALKYSAAEEDNLFENLDKAAKEDKTIDSTLNVKDLFGSWSNQKGFPVLKIFRNDNGSITVHQEKYADPYDVNSTDTTTWWVPFNYASKQSPSFNVTTPKAWLPKGTVHTLITSDDTTTWSNDEWVIFNIQQTGYYRIWYDDKNYNLINNELNSGNPLLIHEINRAHYIDDLSAMVATGRVQPQFLFNALTYLKNEIQYAPWVSAQRSILKLNQVFAGSEKLVKFRAFVADIVTNFYKNKTLDAVDDEGIFEKLSRNIAVKLACHFGVSQCLEETSTAFKTFIKSGTKPLVEIRAAIYANGIRNATESELKKFWSVFKAAATSDEERAEIITSFGNIQNSTLIEYYLNQTIVDLGTTVTKANRVSVINSISGGSQTGLNLTIHFLENNLADANTTIGSIPSILSSIASNVVTTEIQTKFFTLVDQSKTGGYITDTEVTSLKSTVNKNVDWQKSNLASYEAALPKDDPNSAASMTALPALLVLMFCLVRWNVE